VALTGCPEVISSLFGGTLSINNIPAQYNGKYIYFEARNSDAWVIGCSSTSGSTVTLVKIVNGDASIPVWLVGSNNNLSRYTGNDIFTNNGMGDYITVRIYDAAKITYGSSGYLDEITFMEIPFVYGNATVSANNVTLPPDPIDPGISLKPTDILSITNMPAENTVITFGLAQANPVIQGEPLNLAFIKARLAAEKPRLMDSPTAMRLKNELPKVKPPEGIAKALLAGPSFVTWTEGAKKSFWMDKLVSSGSTAITWEQTPSTLIKQGTYCNIWVEDAKFETGSSNYTTLANKFDAIYPLATNLLGFEKGGGPGGDGGIDGDPRIQILVVDINTRNFINPVNGGIGGYFWAKDEYPQGMAGSLKSNEMEIFYVDSYFVKNEPDWMVSVLIHEFQHMIHFNKKGNNSETWYNEMLAMLAEDVIYPKVKIDAQDNGHPINVRIPFFLDVYDSYGLEEWDDQGALTYSTAYGFGAYLIRNYGGPMLIHEMLFNSSVNISSVDAALKAIDPVNYSFEKAFERYAEALVYSKTHGGITGKVTFDNTVSSTINGQTYTATGFDIWNMSTTYSSLRQSLQNQCNGQFNVFGGLVTINMKGPLVYPFFVYPLGYEMPGRSIMLHSAGLNGLTSGKASVIYWKNPLSSDIRIKAYEF